MQQCNSWFCTLLLTRHYAVDYAIMPHLTPPADLMYTCPATTVGCYAMIRYALDLCKQAICKQLLFRLQTSDHMQNSFYEELLGYCYLQLSLLLLKAPRMHLDCNPGVTSVTRNRSPSSETILQHTESFCAIFLLVSLHLPFAPGLFSAPSRLIHFWNC